MGKIPIAKFGELTEFVTENIEHNNTILESYCEHINGMERRLATLEYNQFGSISPNRKGDQMGSSQKFLENIDKMAELNNDGTIDKVDAGMFFKYVATILTSLVTLISVLFGVDENFIKENWPMYFVLLFISILTTVGILYVKSIVVKKDEKIKANQEKARELVKTITRLEYEAMETNHTHQLDIINKDFLLKIKDAMAKEEFAKISKYFDKGETNEPPT